MTHIGSISLPAAEGFVESEIKGSVEPKINVVLEAMGAGTINWQPTSRRVPSSGLKITAGDTPRRADPSGPSSFCLAWLNDLANTIKERLRVSASIRPLDMDVVQDTFESCVDASMPALAERLQTSGDEAIRHRGLN